MGRLFKSSLFPIILVVVLITLLSFWWMNSSGSEPLTFNEFQDAVQAGNVKDVTVKIKDRVVEGTQTTSDRSFAIGFTESFDMEEFLLANDVEFNTDPQGSSIWGYEWDCKYGCKSPNIYIVLYHLLRIYEIFGKELIRSRYCGCCFWGGCGGGGFFLFNICLEPG